MCGCRRDRQMKLLMLPAPLGWQSSSGRTFKRSVWRYSPSDSGPLTEKCAPRPKSLAAAAVFSNFQGLLRLAVAAFTGPKVTAQIIGPGPRDPGRECTPAQRICWQLHAAQQQLHSKPAQRLTRRMQPKPPTYTTNPRVGPRAGWTLQCDQSLRQKISGWANTNIWCQARDGAINTHMDNGQTPSSTSPPLGALQHCNPPLLLSSHNFSHPSSPFLIPASPRKKLARPHAPGSGTCSKPDPPTYTVRPRLAFMPFVPSAAS